MSTLASVFGYGLLSARPAASVAGRFYYATDTTLMYRDNGSTWDTLAVGTGSVATDAIWDAAGDLAVGTGANTAARLPIGNPGGALSRVNGAAAWNSGTSFPTAATGDRYWRTDLAAEGYYDGTRWLTSVLYRESFEDEGATVPISATGTPLRWAWDGASADVWVDRIELMTYHQSPTGTNFWSIQAIKGTAAESESNVGSAAVTSSDTSNNWTVHNITVGALLGTTMRYIRLSATKNASATAVYIKARCVYRPVLT